MKIFEHKSYRTYLDAYRDQLPNGGRGFRSRIADVCRCQTAYVSQVFAGKANFSLEQAEALNGLLGHGQAEAHFFLLLVQLDRAATPGLRTYFADQVARERERQRNLKERFGIKDQLSMEDKARYYSSWIYAACHAGISLTDGSRKESLAKRLRLPVQVVGDALTVLESTGLVKRGKDDTYEIGTSRMHLGADSPLVAKHHANWRLRSLDDLDTAPGDGVRIHYSSIVTVSRADAEKIEAMLLASIDKTKKVVRESEPQEELLCFALDLFPV